MATTRQRASAEQKPGTVEDDGRRYVRLQPYDKRRGFECMRHTIGGRTFEAPNWYVMDPGPAALLGEQHQGNGTEDAPLLFEVCTRGEYDRAIRRDMRRSMADLAGGSLADDDAQLPAPLEPPKSGPSVDRFAGMFDTAKPVEPPKTTAAPTVTRTRGRS